MKWFFSATLVVLALALSLSLWASPFVKGTEEPVQPALAHYGQEVVGQLDTTFLAAMMGTGGTVLQGLPLAGEGHADVELEAFSPFTPDCRIVEMTDAGPVEHPVPGDRRYFRATVLAPAQGFGLFAFERGDFSGFLNFDGSLYLYGVTSGPSGGPLAASCKFLPDRPGPDYQVCQNSLLDVQAPLGETAMPAIKPFERGTWPLQANLALEMDYDTFLYFHTVAASVKYAGDLAAAMSVIYQNDIQTTIGVVSVRVWSTSSDPYRSGTDTSGLLADLKAEYLAHMGSVSRASAMLMSRRNMGGIAYVEVLCNNTWAYEVCGIDGDHTYPTSAYTWDVNCTTHELGHTFKSHHTHCYGTNVGLGDWIDKCYNQEGGCYSGSVVNPPMAEKTIMSYCHLLSPGEVTLTFTDKFDYTRNVIRQGAEGALCLEAPACAFTCTPSASASIMAPPADIIFAGSPVATSCTGTPTWSWTFGDGGTSTLENPSHSYPNAGTYNWSVTGTLSGKTCSGSGSIVVTACTLACTASGPSTATTTTPAAFTSTATPGATCTGNASYDWDYGDGTAHGTTQNPSHLYTAAGTYTWTMTASVSGTTCTKSGSITITASCTLSCTATVPAVGEAGLPVSFQATATPSNCSGNVTYDWNFGDGTTHSTTQNPSHAYTAPGSYHWLLTTKIGAATCTKDGNITIAPGCVLSCTASTSPTTGEAPLPVNFTVQVTASGCTAAPSFSWDFGDGSTSAVQNPIYTYTNPGIFNWSVTVSAEGRTCIQTGSVTVSPACVVTCSASASPTSGLAPLEVTFAATSTATNCTGGTTYAWAFGDGANSAQQNPTHTYASTGTYDWTLTVTVNGKTCSKGGTITVGEPCTLTCTATVPGTGRAGDPLAFTATAEATHCTGAPTFAWTFGDGATSDQQNPTHTFAVSGSYPWTLTVTADDRTCTQTGTVAVTPPCVLSCEADAAPSAGIAPLAVAFTATATVTDCIGSPTFAWTFGDGATSTEQNPAHTYNAAGTFTWTVTASVEGLTCTQTGTVTASEPCALTCEASATPTSGSAPLEVAFTGSATASHCSSAPAFAWGFGDGTSSSVQSPSHTYATQGTYTWTLAVTADDRTCTATGIITVRPGLPGDCDGDGSVSIGEVQKAINMFLGIIPPDCGVDCNGDGIISIGEVQKVINAFLGLAVSC